MLRRDTEEVRKSKGQIPSLSISATAAALVIVDSYLSIGRHTTAARRHIAAPTDRRRVIKRLRLTFIVTSKVSLHITDMGAWSRCSRC